MKQDFYINDDAVGRKRARGDGWTVLIISLLVLLLVLGILIINWVRRQNTEAQQALVRYEELVSDNDYAGIVTLHAEAMTASLDRGQTEANQLVWSGLQRDIEEDIAERTNQIAADLIAAQEPKLAPEDLAYLNGMGRLSASYLDQNMIEVGLAILDGEEDSAHARKVYLALRDVTAVAEAAADYLRDIPNMRIAAPVYQSVLQLQESGAYTQASNRLQDLVESGDLTEGGFTWSQMNQALQRSRDELKPRVLEEVRSLMENRRYISARDRVQSLQEIYPEDSELNGILEEIKQYISPDLTLYSGSIEHIVVKPLIANVTLGFSASSVSLATEQSMLTTLEFQRLLDELYERNYVLIDYTSLLTSNGDTSELYLPKGKRPLILTLEDMTYTAPRVQLSGNNSQLVLDAQGNPAGRYTSDDGTIVTDRNAEAIGILDAFVEEHPDFSFDGARGIIALSGNQGIFGYILNEQQLNTWNANASSFGLARRPQPDYAAARAELTEVVKRLRETGWNFACFTYSGKEVTSMSLETLQKDTMQWWTEVGSIVGESSIYYYPAGSILRDDDERKTWLIGSGFHFFGGRGPSAYRHIDSGYYFMDRLYIGGYALREGLVDRLVGSRSVYDSRRPVPYSVDETVPAGTLPPDYVGQTAATTASP